MRQTAVRRTRNVAVKRSLRTAMKTFAAQPSAESLSSAQSRLDTMVKKGLLPKNTAARRKAKLAATAKAAGSAAKPAKKTAAKAAPKAAKKPAAKTTAKPAAKAPAKKPATKKTKTT
jgi:ribosomal protein S20